MHLIREKRKNAKLETEIVTDIKLLHVNLNKVNVQLLEQKRQELFEIR